MTCVKGWFDPEGLKKAQMKKEKQDKFLFRFAVFLMLIGGTVIITFLVKLLIKLIKSML